MDRPNIVFIMADDLGYADLSCYGQLDFQTPHLDRLAAQGVRFTQGYANSPVCSATRTAVITGRYQYRLPIGLEEPLTRNSAKKLGLPADHPTLPSLLRDLGYATTLVGKWHLGYFPEFTPLNSGYNSFFGVTGGFADYFDHGPGSVASLLHDGKEIERPGYMTDVLGNEAVRQITEFATKRTSFSMSLHYTAPHWPWEGPDDEAVSRGFRSFADYFHYDGGTQKTYGRMVQRLDESVGKVLAALEHHGLANNTIVIFTSDNGGERFSKTWPFIGQKTELLEGGMRVPTLFRWPARVKPAISDQVVISMDWLPTVIAAAGGVPHRDYPADGDNLLPVLIDGKPSYPRKLFWRYKFAAQRAVRDAHWKYLRIAGNEFLFDIVADPRERANLRKRYPETFERLKSEYEAWNATMLPETETPVHHAPYGNVIADRYGVVGDMRGTDV
jgi:arylsulfatase A-like enzyme